MDELNALEAAKAIIAKRASDPRAKAFGFSDDLRAIGSALDELERRVGISAEACLLVYEQLLAADRYQTVHSKQRVAPRVHTAVVESLGQMNDHAAAIARRIVHGQQCTCKDCMGG